MADVIIPQKECSKCKKLLPLTAEYFHRDSRLPSGFRPACKDCCYRKQRPESRVNRVQFRLLRIRLIERGFRFCPKCENIKANTDEFYYTSETNLGAWCKACQGEKNRPLAIAHYHKAKSEGRINTDQKRIRTRDWKRRNRSKTRLDWHKYQSRKASQKVDFSHTDWQHALNYFNGCCAVCGKQVGDLFGNIPAQADHWIPVSSPNCPGTVKTNIVPLCGQVGGCNQLKGSKPPAEWLLERYGKRKAKQILDRINTYFRSLEG